MQSIYVVEGEDSPGSDQDSQNGCDINVLLQEVWIRRTEYVDTLADQIPFRRSSQRMQRGRYAHRAWTALLLIASLTFASEVDLALSSAVRHPIQFQPPSARLAPNPIPLACF
jgi:hypothetical protein